MLKIIDNINLDILKKFGFEARYNEYNGELNVYIKYRTDYIMGSSIKHKIIRIEKTKIKDKIYWIIQLIEKDNETLCELYDLIKLGLVEKVSDK